MSVLPQDETGKAEHGYDYDFDMPKTAIYVDDGLGGVELWDGDLTLVGDVQIDTDALEQHIVDQLAQYKFSGYVVSGTAVYIGHEDKAGAYYVQYIETSTGVVTYAVGTGGIPIPGNYSGLDFGSFASKF